jgi:hypothetical protein
MTCLPGKNGIVSVRELLSFAFFSAWYFVSFEILPCLFPFFYFSNSVINVLYQIIFGQTSRV